MRSFARSGVFALVLLIAPSGAGVPDAAVVRPGVRVIGATPRQVHLIRWAVHRFEAAGLDAPSVEIQFHTGSSGCGGHLGYAVPGHVDLCTSLVNATARWAILHELGHVWLDQNTTPSVRDRFMEIRGLRTWNSASDTWSARGFEQGAEIMSWALGERILTPEIPNNDPGQMTRAYELLTGAASPPRTSGSG